MLTAGLRRSGRLPVHEARAWHASVLDGTTLRVAGRYRPLRALAPASDLDLCLRRRDGETVRLCSLDVEPGPHAAVTFEATAVLVVAGRAPRLGPGFWDAYVREPGGRMVPLRAPALPRDSGPTLGNPRSPVDGWRYRPRRTSLGQLYLEVTRFPPHAEVERVRPSVTGLIIEGRVVGIPAPPAGGGETPVAVLECSDRGSGRVARVPAQWSGDRFTAAAPPEEFLGGAGSRTWELALRIPPVREPLLVGRFLDDLRRPASAYRYPRVVVGPGGGDATALQLAYTDDGRLVLRCAPAGQERGR